jgi:hypothetical protein
MPAMFNNTHTPLAKTTAHLTPLKALPRTVTLHHMRLPLKVDIRAAHNVASNSSLTVMLLVTRHQLLGVLR